MSPIAEKIRKLNGVQENNLAKWLSQYTNEDLSVSHS